ncbi:Bidirectional sugar transporter SWEET2a [Hordeum vulgare]|nr:Bidirectional sugar transporter SWEET2a [Hordeum vulgare]
MGQELQVSTATTIPFALLLRPLLSSSSSWRRCLDLVRPVLDRRLLFTLNLLPGNIFAFVLFISPLPTFRRIVRNGSTEQFSATPYIYSLLNCLVCMWYALPFVSYGVVLVATVNTIGAVFQLAYTAVFIAYADAKKRLKVLVLLAGVFCVFGLIVYVSMALFDHKPRRTFVGYLSVASLIFMFASPLSIINLVIRTKSVEYMPFYLSLSMSLMSVSFFAYGALLDDFFIYMDDS